MAQATAYEAIAARKAALRRRMRARRETLAAPEAGERLAELAWRPLLEQAGIDGMVAGYWPIHHEIDPRPLMERLAGHEVTLALPVVTARHQPLIFRRWRPGEPLIRGAFGVPVPPEDAPTLRPAVVLVPLLAFSRAGHRLGYGGGYYDRTLAGLRATGRVLAVGLAHAEQELDELPVTPDDSPLDMIVTDRAIHEVKEES